MSPTSEEEAVLAALNDDAVDDTVRASPFKTGSTGEFFYVLG